MIKYSLKYGLINMKIYCVNKKHEKNELVYNSVRESWVCNKCVNYVIRELVDNMEKKLKDKPVGTVVPFDKVREIIMEVD